MTAVLDRPDTRPRAPRVNHPLQDAGNRCRRADRCINRAATVDDTGLPAGWVGADLDRPDGLCPACSAQARDAVLRLPGDVDELGALLVPTLEVRLSTDDTTDGGRKLHPPLPIALHPHAVRSYIVGTVIDWTVTVVGADLTAAEAAAWEPELVGHGDVIRACVEQLAHQWDAFLAFGPTPQRLRSVTADPLDGWKLAARHAPRWWRVRPALDALTGEWFDEPVDPADEVTRAGAGDDLWFRPDGVTVALQLAAIHEQVLSWSGFGREPALPVPCPACRRRRLVRRHSLRVVECDACHETRMTDDEYDLYRRGAWSPRRPSREGGPR